MKNCIFVLLMILVGFSVVTATSTSVYTLGNGMEVILKENHAMPLISSVVVVKAGSKYENDQNNGFTHLLEHMLFNGTENRTRLELNEGVKDFGGYINAFTRQEMTGYLIVMPAEFIDQGLDIQADQLFYSILPADEFPKERDIVAEEIKKDNDVDDNVAYDFFNSVLYKGTPYSRPVIGYESSIRNVSRDEVLKYYKERYVPNNMTALIIGDFNTVDMLEKVNRYFGSVPRGALPQFPEFSISPPYENAVNIKRFPTSTSYVQISLPAPQYSNKDYFAVDILAQYLNSGESSPLYQALISSATPLATELNVGLEMQKEFTMLNINIKADSSANIQNIVTATLTALNEISQRKFTPEELRRVVTPVKVNDIKLEEKLHYYGIMKAPVLATCGIDFLENYLDNLSKVTPAMVEQVALNYLKSPKYVASALVNDTEAK